MKNVLKAFIICGLMQISFSAVSQTGGYVILTTTSDTTDTWFEPVRILRNYRNAQVVPIDPGNVFGALAPLMGYMPRYVAVVLKPEELYINFVREFLMMSTQLDPDPFTDFSYGYITGATAQDAVNFVNRIIQAETQNIKNYPLRASGYAASTVNFVYPFSSNYFHYLNPTVSSTIYMKTDDSASGKNFFLANTNLMLNNKVLNIGHNGDPHMVWLFEGGNSNPNPSVWNYDPLKIEDPAYARVGLTSFDIAPLNLYPAVAFNGACHQAVPKKVLVESDIAATFGHTQGSAQFYTMSDTFSFALSILKTGITGYFAACGANNANDGGEDLYNAFLYNEPLGDIHKRSHDGVVMGFLGNPINLKLFQQGGSTSGCDVLASGSFNPNQWSGACYMLGGKANRIYFGDPLFHPYELNKSDSLVLTRSNITQINPTTLDVTLSFKKPSGHWPVWDKFHHGQTRIYKAVEMPALFGNVTSFNVIDSTGPNSMVVHALEKFHGKTFLHIEVDIPVSNMDAASYTITFRVNHTLTNVQEANNLPHLPTHVYPNPAGESITISFHNPEGTSHSVQLMDGSGRVVKQANGVKDNSFTFDTRELSPGVYFYQVQRPDGGAGRGKVLIM
jgi:hypothetical protein